MSRLRDDIEQLTARMTTPAANVADQSDIESMERPEIMVLIMGHLPVRAGLWRLPTACFLLPECQSIIVARQENDDLFLEWTGSSVVDLDESGLSMLEHLPSHSKFVVVPDSNIDAEVLADMAPDRVALVTGGDQAAIVGAYSQLKNLKIDSEVAIELVIVGSEPDKVGETATRLIDAASRHLDCEIRFAGAIERIEANTGLVASCEVADQDGGLLELVRRVRRGPAPSRNQSADSANQRVVSTGMSGDMSTTGSFARNMVHPEYEVDDSSASEIESDCKRLLPMQPVVMKHAQEAAEVVVPPLESPELDAQTRTPSVDAPVEASLASHLENLRALPVNAPVCPSIELAVDDSGQLHLLARDVDVSGIPVVQNWIREHQDLLTMALPDVRFHHPESIRIHVLGQDVKVLCGLRGTGWHPHLLVRVDEATRGNWMHVSLED
ncbi:MAG: hypothetical protein CMJ40_00455 [Phycisphaerae bacterium]|nr:hypothetical protein [Phycisphaerae bacterium]